MTYVKEHYLKYTINLSFEEIKLPPFQDILVLGKNGKQGKLGLLKSFEMLVPNGFQLLEVQHPQVEAVFINKKILNKLPAEKILSLLQEKVFNFVSEGELLKVDFRVKISMSEIELDDIYDHK